MKKLLIISLVSFSLIACSKAPQEQKKEINTGNAETKITSNANQNNDFDLKKLPTTTVEPSTFPYVQLPTVFAENGHTLKDFDKFYFAINGKPVALEGRLYDVAITSKDNTAQFSAPLMTQSFEEQMQKIGAKKLNSQEIPYELYEKIPDYAEKSEINIGEITHTYGFKNKDGVPVIVQLTLNSPKIFVMEIKPIAVELKPLDTSQTAETLEKSIKDTGKATVQINFSVNSAVIESSSKNTIDEILKLLQDDKTLKLAIHGHTDNSGTAENNLKLSEHRAQSVRAALIEKNIAADRLKAEGFGQTQPIASNDTEDGKAQNRRVELIKIN